jgi:hypothetical protein
MSTFLTKGGSVKKVLIESATGQIDFASVISARLTCVILLAAGLPRLTGENGIPFRGRANAYLQLTPGFILSPPNTEKLGGHMIGDDCRRRVALHVQRKSELNLQVMVLIKTQVRSEALSMRQRGDLPPKIRDQLTAVAERADREIEFIEGAIRLLRQIRPTVRLVVDNCRTTGQVIIQ